MQTRREPKKGKSTILDQMGERQANTSHGKRNCTLCLEEKPMIMKGRSKKIGASQRSDWSRIHVLSEFRT